jgi:hypothetical protein
VEAIISMADDELYKQALSLRTLLISHATGGAANEADYAALRRALMNNPRTKGLLPSFVRTTFDLQSFWGFIKAQSPTYAERRLYINDEFSNLLLTLETGVSPFDNTVLKTTADYNVYIQNEWGKAIERRATDPEGAITSARTLLETVCKHILDETSTSYTNDGDLQKLYKETAKALNLSPDQHTEEQFKQILGGGMSVVNGLSSLRNKLSDSHGRGTRHVRPSQRHAALCVNMAGTVAEFLIKTLIAQKGTTQ